MDEQPISLSLKNFNTLFPFFIRMDENLVVRAQGSSLQKMIGSIEGKNLDQVFDLIRPRLSISMKFNSIADQLDTIFILEAKAQNVRFRGQFIIHEGDLIYLCSPWLNDIQDLEKNKLQITDFAIHDSITDNLQLLRSKQIANDDMIRLNEELIKQRDILLENSKKIQEAEDRYKDIVESSSEIIYRVNSSGQYIYVNPTTEKITGYSREELIGRDYNFILQEKYLTKIQNFYAFQLKENLESTYIEFPILKKNQQEIWIGQSVNIVHKANGDFEYIALARDITDRKIAEKALILSEDKYKSIIENLELGLLEVDTEGNIIKAYPKFCELTDYEEHELIGKNAGALFLDEEAQQVLEQQNQNRLKGQAGVYELQLRKKGGKKIWVIVSGAPYYNLNGEFIGSVGIHLDITQRKEMEEAYLNAKEIAENSVKAKDAFLANMSHEIRTPLNAIIGMSELVLQQHLSGEQQTYVEAIHHSSENLLNIINDILDFSKINSGKLELEEIPVHLKAIIEKSISLLKLKADEKEILLSSDLSCLGDQHYLCDPVRLGEVFTNLISNAVKFTMEGEVSVKCELLKKLKDQDRLLFRVCDTGIGIEADKINLIFDHFTQANEAITRNFGGTGLGLSISKNLLELMGSSLQVRSTYQQGSEFYFELVLQKTDLGSNPLPPEKMDTAFLADKHLLIADDNAMNLFLAKSILEKWNCEVTTVLNGAEAVDMVQNHHFDLVLMDIRMPVLDGIGAAWMIRHKLKKQIPIIALTANAQQSDLEKYLENGMNDYLCKPFKQRELCEVLARFLKDLPDSSVKPSPASLVDLSALRETCQNDEQFVHQMISLFLETSSENLQILRTAMFQKDRTTIQNMAHKLKPSLQYLAKAELSALALSIEQNTGHDFEKDWEEFASKIERLLIELKDYLGDSSLSQ